MGSGWASYRVYLAAQTDLVQVFKGIFIVFFVRSGTDGNGRQSAIQCSVG